MFSHLEYKGTPWVTRTSRPYDITRGLEGRHIALWQSHGKYYKKDKDKLGNGNVPACSVPQKTCSPNHSSYLILYPCWKMREP